MAQELLKNEMIYRDRVVELIGESPFAKESNEDVTETLEDDSKKQEEKQQGTEGEVGTLNFSKEAQDGVSAPATKTMKAKAKSRRAVKSQVSRKNNFQA